MTTSSVDVVVSETLTSISNIGEPPVATALDQFENPLGHPTGIHRELQTKPVRWPLKTT